MAHELMITRKHLREREKPLSSDVADAICRIVGLDQKKLPVAITKRDILDLLIDIYQEGEGDEPGTPLRPAAKRALTDSWFNLLSNTATFQSGYKHYESNEAYGNFPVVPVTDYFFKVIFGNGSVAEVLDAMSDYEVMHSLPKRPGRAQDRGGVDYVRDESGAVASFGELAGILVFPRNSNAPLLRRWLERRGNMAEGQMQGALAAIGHARPNAPAVQNLKSAVNGLGSTIAKALPRPKK